MKMEDENLSKEMDLLLNNYWITKDESPEDYYLLKRKQTPLRKFISKNLGSNLLVHDRFIKLEKISSIPSKDQGIEEFLNTMDYVLLFIMLIYLEDKPRGEKFILSSLIEYVKNTAITLELSNIPDWNYASHRRSLVRVINYLLEKHIIILKDEDKISFQEDKTADALYEVTGISNYLIPHFGTDIYNLKTPEEFLEIQWVGQDQAHGDIRRYKVYRNLLYLPAIYRENISDSEDDYLRKMHKNIEKELLDNLDLTTEITKNMALIYTDESSIQKDYFPNNKRITDIILLINKEIADYINRANIKQSSLETFTINSDTLKQIITESREKLKPYFSKAYLNLTPKKYLEEIIQTMEDYHFIKENISTFTVYPLIYRFLGDPEPVKKENNEQIEIFGGEEYEL